MDIQKELNGTRNLFLTGPAGTGKSYILNDYISTHDNVLVCAPTGIAALNIGGDTMHKVFHIPVPAFESPSFAKGKKGAITNGMLQLIANADTIIIDEISMCRNDVFRFAIKVIRKAEKLKGSKIRIIVSGDFSQLPPVVKKDEIKLMKKFGLDPSGYAFTTQEWKSCNFKVIELTEVKRQEDEEFIGGFTNDIIIVKPDAKVIFTANDLINGQYKNGTFGRIIALEENKVFISIDGEKVEVYRHDYPIYTYTVSGTSLNKKEVGKIRQFPFKLGKAITIHKSQGQTFNNVIISPEIFAPGQLYVVLSRVRSQKGIKLLRRIDPEQLMVDPVVVKFYKNNYSWKDIPQKPAPRKKTPTNKPSTKATAKKAKTKSTAKKAVSRTKKRTNQKSTNKNKKR